MTSAIIAGDPGCRDGSTPEVPPTLLALQEEFGAPILMIVDNLGLTDELPYAVAEALGDRHFENLGVLLVSHGGDAAAAFKAACVIRNHVDQGGLGFFLPAHAESAATLMCLVADWICMAETAALGALDVQVGETLLDGTTGFVSSLCLSEGLDSLAELAVTMQGKVAGSVSAHTSLSTSEVLRTANDLVARLLEPVLAHVDVETVGSRKRERQLALQLGSRLLAMADVVPAGARDELLNTLVYGYADHGFSVMAAEAEALGLPIIPAGERYGRVLRDLSPLRDWTDDRYLNLIQPVDEDVYDVVLADPCDRRIAVAHEVRRFTDLGVKESRELVASAPVVVASHVSATRAASIRARLEAAGGLVEVESARSADLGGVGNQCGGETIHQSAG